MHGLTTILRPSYRTLYFAATGIVLFVELFCYWYSEYFAHLDIDTAWPLLAVMLGTALISWFGRRSQRRPATAIPIRTRFSLLLPVFALFLLPLAIAMVLILIAQFPSFAFVIGQPLDAILVRNVTRSILTGVLGAIALLFSLAFILTAYSARFCQWIGYLLANLRLSIPQLYLRPTPPRAPPA